MTRACRFGLLAIVTAISPSAWGQSLTPAQLVDAFLHGDHAVMRRAVQHADGAHTWTFPLPTQRGRCYQVFGAVVGESHVSFEVHVRASRVMPATMLAAGTVQYARFCASLPGAAYTVQVQTDGAARWALAARETPRPAGSGDETQHPAPDDAANHGPPPAMASPAPGPSASAGMAPPVPVGGPENDYVTNQIRQLVAGHPSWRAATSAWRWTLDASQSQDAPVALTDGHCVTVVAAGMPSVTDVDLALADPAGNRVAQDAGHRGVETLHYCPGYSGTYRLTVHLFAGRGPVGVQVFEEH